MFLLKDFLVNGCDIMCWYVNILDDYNLNYTDWTNVLITGQPLIKKKKERNGFISMHVLACGKAAKCFNLAKI